jgi:hypothetical protein
MSAMIKKIDYLTYRMKGVGYGEEKGREDRQKERNRRRGIEGEE